MSSLMSVLAVAVLAVTCCVYASTEEWTWETVSRYDTDYPVVFHFEEEEGTIFIKGTGDMPYPYYSYDAPWYDYRDLVRKVVIDEGVTSISSNAFYECSNMVSISIPSTVTSIGDYAFLGCQSLSSVNIPKACTYISTGVFQDCSSFSSINVEDGNSQYFSKEGVLIDKGNEWTAPSVVKCPPLRNGPFDIPDGITEIRPNAFKDTINLTSITFPESVNTIGEYAFSGCSALSSVDIPRTVTNIGPFTFYQCSNLTSVTIHEGVISIGNAAFYECENLASISIPESVTSIYEAAFFGCKNLKSLSLPKNVNTMGTGVFAGCESLESISVDEDNDYFKCEDNVLFNSDFTELIQYPLARSGSYVIPGTVEHFSSGAFATSRGLTSLSIPSSVTTIESGSFMGCVNLEEIVIPDDVTSIGMSAFYECKSLKSVTIPSKVTEIDTTTFSGCSSLSSVVIPSSVTKIWYKSFEGCSSLKNVTIPRSVTNLDTTAFSNCQELESIFVEAGNSNYKDINGVLFSQDETTLLQYPSGRKGEYTISGNVKSVSHQAFQYCSGITSLTILASITEIPLGFFYGCINLESVNIPNTVQSIGNYAFNDCISLKSLTIPSSVTSIGERVFANCSSLTSINIEGDTSSYKSVNGVLLDATGTHLVLYPRGKTGEFEIPDGVKYIDAEAFAWSYGLESVTIPASVTEIGQDAFLDCTSLKTVNGGAGVTRIGMRAFTGCKSLTFNELLPSVESFDAFAFSQCEQITSLIIPSSVNSVEDYAFAYMKNLVYVIYEGTQDPGNWSYGLPFYMCTNLEFICVPPNYESSSFCGRTAITKSDKCEELAANINQCFTVRTDESVVKRANASAWEDQSDGCFQFICLNETGRHSWSLCNSSDGGNELCSENQCKDIDASELSDDGYSVDIKINPLLINEINKSRDMKVLCNASGTEVSEVRVTTQADFDGLLIRVIVTFDDEDSATNLATVCDTCAGMTFDVDNEEEEEEESTCSGILRHVHSATLIRHNSRTLDFIESAPSVTMNSVVIALFMIIAIAVSYY